jgi:hypothetical protein
MLLARAIVGQFASRVVGNLGNGTVSCGPADRPDREMKDRHIMSEVIRLLGRKNGALRAVVSPFRKWRKRTGIAGKLPRCVSALRQGELVLEISWFSPLVDEPDGSI